MPVAASLAGGGPRAKIGPRRRVTVPEIDIYTQPWCPYCARAVALLHSKGVAFREIDAPHGTPERAELIRRAGGRTSVPQIFIGETHVGGCDELLRLDRDGKLGAMLKSA